MIRLLRSTPIITLSLASSKSNCVTTLRFCRAAISAASFTRFARSAPANPGVPRAMVVKSTSSRERSLLGMDLQDLLAALHIRPSHHHPPVETARPQQRRIQHVRTIGRRHQDDAFVRFEPVHLHQQLIERLLALVVTAAEARAAMPAHRVDFIDKDDARGVLLALLEQIADAAARPRRRTFPRNPNPKSRRTARWLRPRWRAPAASCPFPASPISSTPFGMRPPSFWNFCGSRRNSMISCSSSLASSTPATSLNVTFFCCEECSRARDLAEAQRLVAARSASAAS